MRANGGPVDYWLDADHQHGDKARSIADNVFGVMVDNILNHPRSLQTRIGPSEMGLPCDRRLLHRIAEKKEPPRNAAWKPQVGVSLHDQQERWFTAESTKPSAANRWLCEESVAVGTIGPQPINGSTDLFDSWGNAVADWKFIGPSRLKSYRANGPGPQYRTQAHLYGRGWALDGWKVDLVMIFFIPRDGELSDSFVWSEPYNETIALDALERCNRLYRLVEAVGLDQALGLFAPCDDQWCPWCAPEQQVAKLQAAGSPFAINQ